MVQCRQGGDRHGYQRNPFGTAHQTRTFPRTVSGTSARDPAGSFPLGGWSFPKLKKLPTNSRLHYFQYENQKFIGGIIMAQNLTCTQCGDYYIPDIKLEHTGAQALGKYGKMRRTFLEQNKPMLFNDMVLTETLFPHLCEVQQTCEQLMGLLIAKLLVRNPAPDKATQQLAWIAHMNSLKVQAEESVLRELVYDEDIV